MPTVGFLGCGQMGEALAKGMIANVCPATARVGPNAG